MENDRQKDVQEIQNIIEYYENLREEQKLSPAKIGDIWIDDTGTLKVCNRIINGVRYWSVIKGQ